jgi:hypothetical protein
MSASTSFSGKLAEPMVTEVEPGSRSAEFSLASGPPANSTLETRPAV